MTSSGGIGSTLTGGIQDIAAILPLLGTEQCSVQVSSALTRGYLYAASAPMSIFGSLGVVSAGFKTFAACFSLGARILGNMGFEPQGENLSLIMVEAGTKAGKGNTGRYIIETRMDELIKELNIDRNRITGVSHKSAAWNVKMMATTALLCAFSIAPYIYLNRGASNLKKSTTWVFPVLRATGGFITATLIQLLIQQRITTLSHQLLVKRDQLPNPDVEAAIKPGDTKKRRMDARTWLLLCLLLIGLVASVVGYVGCFSVVQNSTSTISPVSWLCLEAGLPVVRLVIWAWNPMGDDAPPLEIMLKLDEYKPFPTCNKSDEEILQYQLLPLTRAQDFLKTITSFAGLIDPFSNPDLSLYYTLTRKLSSAPWNKLGERSLYITVFDHKERTTRVYTRDNKIDTFYSTKSDAPVVDAGHFLLEVEIDVKINPEVDPVSSDSNNLDSLRNHHRSILEHIQYRLGAGNVTELYAIENSWTMKVEDTISTLRRLREENENIWKKVVENGKKEERNEESVLIRNYFRHSSINRERRLLDEKRVKWIARRMRMIIEEMKERSQGKMGTEYRVNMQAVEMRPATKLQDGEIEPEALLFWEQYLMELLLLYEVKEWERLFWNTFLDQIGSCPGEVGERLKREWRANCWKRLNPQMHAAVKRLTDFDTTDKGFYIETLGDRWVSSIGQLLDGVENPNSISLSNMREEMEQNDEIHLRMEEEIEDTIFRLKLGSDLKRFDQFWDDDTLFECRYSRSKWLILNQPSALPTFPTLKIYSHALKRNTNIIHITFKCDDHPSLLNIWLESCDSPRVTSISWDSFGFDRDSRLIKSINNDLIISATRREIRRKLDPFSTYIFTNADSSDIISLPDGRALGNDARVLISFVAPTSGQSLILRVIHSAEKDSYGPLEVTLGSTMIQLKPSSNLKSSLTIDDITLSPIQVPGPSESSSHLSFEPGIRNDIVVQFGGTSHNRVHWQILHDIELFDEAGGCWRAPQFEGVNQNRVIFNAKPISKSTVYYEIRGKGEGYVMPGVGTARGISLGAEFEVYQNPESDHRLGVVVVSDISPFSTTLHAKEPRFALEGDGVALEISVGTEEHVLRIHVADEGLKSLVKKIERNDPSRRIIKLVERDQAEFGMALEDGKVVFDIFDSLVTKYGLTRMPFSLEPTLEAISPVLHAADHFYWHLRRMPALENDTKKSLGRLANYVEIEVAEMEHDGVTYDDDFNPVLSPTETGWKRGKEFDLQIKDGRTIYGWKIINKCSVALYPALFYFDNSDWSITSLYPPTDSAQDIVSFPLKSHQSFPVGFGEYGSVPHTFFLREEQNVNVGILKLFLSRKQIDLSNVAQPSSGPFSSIQAGYDSYRHTKAVTKMKGPTKLRFPWDAILIPMVQRHADN